MYEIVINWFSPDMDSLAQNFLTAGVGILGIFTVLGLLIGVLYLFQFVFSIINKADADKKAAAAPVAVAPVAAETEDEETVAAIFASIYAVLEQEYGEDLVPPFIIKSISRK